MLKYRTYAPPSAFGGFAHHDKCFVNELGQRIVCSDIKWAKMILDSYRMDDVSYISHAFESPISNTAAVVEGGKFGAPYSIGSYGFFTDGQVDANQSHLKREAQEHLRSFSNFVMKEDWDPIDKSLSERGDHRNFIKNKESEESSNNKKRGGRRKQHPLPPSHQRQLQTRSTTFEKVVCGDSFLHLAVRRDAYKVATQLLKIGLDPLLVNGFGETASNLLTHQYELLGGEFRQFSIKKKRVLSGEEEEKDGKGGDPSSMNENQKRLKKKTFDVLGISLAEQEELDFIEDSLIELALKILWFLSQLIPMLERRMNFMRSLEQIQVEKRVLGEDVSFEEQEEINRLQICQQSFDIAYNLFQNIQKKIVSISQGNYSI